MSSVDHKQVETNLRLSRAFAAKHLPWFAPALFRCRMVISPLVPVAAIDSHYNIYWNPGAVHLIANSTTERQRVLEELAFIWIHEICHVLREHSERARHIQAEAKRWNYAADLEINDSNWPGTRHPTLFPPLLPQQYNLPIGKTTEWYYRQGIKEIEINLGWDDGSGAHGKPRPWESQDSNKQNLPEIGRTIIRREVAQQMKAQLAGKMPGNWNIWVKHTLEPKVDWRQILKKRLSTAIAVGRGSRVDYTYRHPNRRASIYAPIILPSLSGEQHNQLAVVVDTSGSMRGAPLEQAIAEVYGILRQVHQVVNLIPCDAKDYAPIPMKSAADLRNLLKIPGGGGTNMIKGIEAAINLSPAPDTVLVLTDGYTPYPNERYATPVLFGIIGHDHLNTSAQPPNPPWTSDTVVFINLNQ
jgi:predicted metal-dependent peptidase